MQENEASSIAYSRRMKKEVIYMPLVYYVLSVKKCSTCNVKAGVVAFPAFPKLLEYRSISRHRKAVAESATASDQS